MLFKSVKELGVGIQRRAIFALSLGLILLWVANAAAQQMTGDNSAKQVKGKAILDSERVTKAQWEQNLTVLDRLYFEDNIQAYIGETCALAACHGGVRAARLHFERPDINGVFTPAQSQANYRMALWYVVYKQPKQSRLLLKPLDEKSGGLEHSGGNKVQEGAFIYHRLLDWTSGAKVGNVPPTADAGIEQRIQIGSTVKLDGTTSSDRNDDVLTYSWKMLLKPPQSQAKLALTGGGSTRRRNANTVHPTFVPDKEGNYVIELIVNDGKLDSEPDTVLIKAFALLSGMLLIEAEDGELIAPMRRFAANRASGSKYIAVSENASKRGKARYVLNIPEDGDYSIWGQFNVDSPQHNTLLVTLDSAQSYTWRIEPTFGDFLFDRLSQNRIDISGEWRISDSTYLGTAPNRNRSAITRTDYKLSEGSIEAIIASRSFRQGNGPMFAKNAFLVFDYQNKNNFKFAGFYDNDTYHNLSTLWHVVGPFPNENDEGLFEPYPPELEPGEIDLSQSYMGAGGREITWRKIVATDGYGQENYFIDFDKITQINNVVAYGLAYVNSPTDRESVEIFLGSDDGVRIWVNDELIYENHVHRRLVADQDRFTIDLKKGQNKILIKVDEGFAQWGFGMRTTNDKENHYAIGEMKDGVQRVLARADAVIDTGRDYPLRLDLKNGIVTLSETGEHNGQRQTPPLHHDFGKPFSGWIGFLTQGGQAVFDNLIVKDPNGNTQLSDNFDVAKGKPLAIPLKKGRHLMEFSCRQPTRRGNTPVPPPIQIDRLLVVKAGSEDRLDVSARQFVKEVFLDLFQRSPSQAELLYAAGLDRKQLIDFMFNSYEYHDRWYTDQLYYLFLLRRFDPRAPWMLQLPSHLHNGRMTQLDTIKALATCQFYHFRNLGPDNYVNVTFEQLLGRLPEKEELETGKRMYDGNVQTLFGIEGTSQYEVADILMTQSDAYRHYIQRMYKRYFTDEIESEALDRWVKRCVENPRELIEIQKAWLVSAKYQNGISRLRPKSDIQFIRTLYMDLLGREPTQEEFDFVQNAIQAFADPIPLRSVIVKIILDSGAVSFPDKSDLQNSEVWVIDLYLRFLSRQPAGTEIRACLDALARPDCNTKTVVQAILSSLEYQYY